MCAVVQVGLLERTRGLFVANQQLHGPVSQEALKWHEKLKRWDVDTADPNTTL